MPLPTRDTTWPPTALTGITDRYAEWSAWYSSDTTALRTAYAARGEKSHIRPSQRSGGVVGAISRWFWGTPPATSGARSQLHIPIASDLCQASADLLFAEPPALSVNTDTTIQDRLLELAQDDLFGKLAENAEVAAALGSSYLRVTWDKDLADTPFLSVVHADAALPVFRHGRLVAVTFWWVAATHGQTVIRHLEHHELDSAGIGVIEHGLYEGTPDKLGNRIPLTEDPSTIGLAPLVDAQARITTGTPGLAVVHIPNATPQRTWRTHPLGVNLGRSDLDGVEPLMDALDETWTSWMRDVRLAKSRIIVPDSMLASAGPGRGTTFDFDQEVYAPVNTLQGADGNLSQNIVAQQFAIRVEEHRATCDELIHQILRTAGYSLATFGVGDEGGVATATEVNARQQRSDLTRDRKIRLQRPALRQIIAKMLTVDAEVFGGTGKNITAADVQVDFGDAVQDSPLELAQTAQALRVAQAASTKTLVQLVHPDWDEQQVDAEVALIDAASTVSDPAITLPFGAQPGEDADPTGQGEGETTPLNEA